MSRLGVIGLGLMGGSLGMALKVAGADYEVLGYGRRLESRELALESGAVDSVFDDPLELASASDIVVCCLPVMAIPDMLRKCAPAMRAGTLVTDVGSTKEHIVNEMAGVMRSSRAKFIGSHPICGSELTGIESARADLYRGSVTVVTPGPDADPDEFETVSALWRAAGSRVVEMDAGEHDIRMARTSHLPHLTAALLCSAVARDADGTELDKLCGSGFRDASRLADGSPAIWRDVVQTNRNAIATELHVLRDETNRLLQMLEADDFDGIERFLASSRAMRRKLISTEND